MFNPTVTAGSQNELTKELSGAALERTQGGVDRARRRRGVYEGPTWVWADPTEGGPVTSSSVQEFCTIAEAAEIARLSPKRIRNLMAGGTLREGVHFTRPSGITPRFKRAALLAWLDGADEAGQDRPTVGKPVSGSKLNPRLVTGKYR